MRLPNSYKQNSIEMAGYMANLPGYRRRAERQLNCATFLNYVVHPVDSTPDEDAEVYLNFANFCHSRTCAVCQSILSSKLRAKLFGGTKRMFIDHPDLVPIFLTLTVKNCHYVDLRQVLRQMQSGWRCLTRMKGFPAIGYLKSVEITRPYDFYYAGQFIKRIGAKQFNQVLRKVDLNRDLCQLFFSEEVNPHIHALLIVDKSYFHPENIIKHLDWVYRWKKAAKLDYNPVVDIRRVYSGDDNDIAGAVFEISKYCVKPSGLRGKLGFFIVRQMHGLNLISSGGLMREYCREADINQLVETGLTGEEIHQSGVPLNLRWDDLNNMYSIVRLANMEYELP